MQGLLREEFIELARTWVGTPYHHQACIKGVGVDCVGFIKGAAYEAGLLTKEEFDSLPTDYSTQPSGGLLRAGCSVYLTIVDPISNLDVGDVLLMRLEKEEQHLALLSQLHPYPYIMHCHRSGVLEHRIDTTLRNKVTGVWTFKRWGNLLCNL